MHTRNSSAIEVITTTEIAASAETVWRILTDLGDYPRWNPFIRNAKGSLEPGGTVRLRVDAHLGFPLVFRATITRREELRELRWFGDFGGPWLASGDHRFLIEPIDDRRVRFVHSERFAGVLPRLTARLLVPRARAGFEAMNQALVLQAEAAARGSGAPAERVSP